jgi:hypothetical protein
MMEDFFSGCVVAPKQKITKKYSINPVETVIQSVEDAISLLKDPSYKVVKKGKDEKASPQSLWEKRDDGKCQVFVNYARSPLLIKGETSIVCEQSQIELNLKLILKALEAGYFNDQIRERSEEFKRNLKRSKSN